jgi:enoyl-CoA hydratase/carnithine racemase
MTERLGEYDDIEVTRDGYVAHIEMKRPPHNFFGSETVLNIVHAVEHIDRETDVRAIVLSSEGRSFSAGNQFGGGRQEGEAPPAPGDRFGRFHAYDHAALIIASETPVVAAIQGPAIGGGLGLALVAKLVDDHGGVVEYAGEGQPPRTVFRILLPRHKTR